MVAGGATDNNLLDEACYVSYKKVIGKFKDETAGRVRRPAGEHVFFAAGGL